MSWRGTVKVSVCMVCRNPAQVPPSHESFFASRDCLLFCLGFSTVAAMRFTARICKEEYRALPGNNRARYKQFCKLKYQKLKFLDDTLPDEVTEAGQGVAEVNATGQLPLEAPLGPDDCRSPAKVRLGQLEGGEGNCRQMLNHPTSAPSHQHGRGVWLNLAASSDAQSCPRGVRGLPNCAGTPMAGNGSNPTGRDVPVDVLMTVGKEVLAEPHGAKPKGKPKPPPAWPCVREGRRFEL